MASQPTAEIEALHRLQEKLWNDAYDGLKDLEPKVVEAYETILSNGLGHGASPTTGSNNIAEGRRERSLQMREIIALGLERTQKEADTKARLGRGYEIAKGLKGLVDTSLKAAPEAALVWASVTCSLEILSSALTQPGINRDGLERVVASMEWYWNLSRLLVDKKAGMDDAMRGQLEKNITQLYQKLLLYQMRSACTYRRKRLSVFFRDALKIDDWQGKLDEVKDAEADLRNKVSQYNVEATIAQLQAMEVNLVKPIDDLRAWHEAVRSDDKNKEALRDLHITDPRKDKERIEQLKGGLIEDSYRWILQHGDYRKWHSDPDSKLLWIKGDPGKGKTMLLCGIIDELQKENPQLPPSYFFCQATEEQLKTATHVLRGIVFLLIEHVPPLISHLRDEYDSVGKALFTNHNAWTSMSKVLTSMLDEPSLDDAVILVDALDECDESSRPRLIKLISRLSSLFPAKWIVSSRNWPEIERDFGSKAIDETFQLRLEMNADMVSAAINTFIEIKVNDLDYGLEERTAIAKYLKENASGTFLWVALVSEALAKQTTLRVPVQDKLKVLPPDLTELYEQMVEYIKGSEEAGIIKQVLTFAAVAYRPLSLGELFVCIDWRRWSADEGCDSNYANGIDVETLRSIIMSCGSFLIIREDLVYFVHQSAQEFLRKQGSKSAMPMGVAHQHQVNLFKSLHALNLTLRKDIYNLKDPGISMNEISPPAPDPLAPIVYHVYFWVDHLSGWYALKKNDELDKKVAEKVHEFLSTNLLYWLEAHSLLGAMAKAVTAVQRLVELEALRSDKLAKLTRDALRFVYHFRGIIEQAPLQIYVSALLCSPTKSIVRQLFFRSDGPSWVTLHPEPDPEWNSCVHRLDGHRESVEGLVFSPSGRYLASYTICTVIIWDTLSGEKIRVLDVNASDYCVAFAPNKNHLAIADKKCEIWDFLTGDGLPPDW
ncbi:hypothetical protein ACJ41O_000320 [Fusarium nematophilum]